MIKFFKNLDRKIIIYFGIAIGIIILLLVILLILKMSVGSRVNSKVFESRVKEATKAYYKDNKKELPKNNGERKTITIDELVNEGYLKDPDKLLKKNITCEGNVSVANNNGYYLYQPVIECSDGYTTKLLYKKVLKDNPVTHSGNGLYKINNYYLFRGEGIHNYVKFAGMNWRILRINNDNTIRLILVENLESISWDDRYNVDRDDNVGKNDYQLSRIKKKLEKMFNNTDKKMFTSEDKALIVPTELCIGARKQDSIIMDGSIECSRKTEKLPLGLLQANEYTIVSLDEGCKKLDDPQCINYNYLGYLNAFWTLTADADSTYFVYRVNGTVDTVTANSYTQPRLVINLSSDALSSEGNGTSDNPYVVK